MNTEVEVKHCRKVRFSAHIERDLFGNLQGVKIFTWDRMKFQKIMESNYSNLPYVHRERHLKRLLKTYEIV